MKMRLRKVHAAALMLAALLFWQRDGAACVFTGAYDGSGIPIQTVADAIDRVSRTYGKPQAKLYLVDGQNRLVRWLFKANHYAVSVAIPGKSCIVAGPMGKNTDVIAHEMVHAEIAHRIGFAAYLTRIPAWFNEGAAMQADQRPQYDLPDAAVSPDRLAKLTQTSAFYSGDGATVTDRYGLAKRAVSDWLKRNGGNARFYQQLERFRNGEDNLR